MVTSRSPLFRLSAVKQALLSLAVNSLFIALLTLKQPMTYFPSTLFKSKRGLYQNNELSMAVVILFGDLLALVGASEGASSVDGIGYVFTIVNFAAGVLLSIAFKVDYLKTKKSLKKREKSRGSEDSGAGVELGDVTISKKEKNHLKELPMIYQLKKGWVTQVALIEECDDAANKKELLTGLTRQREKMIIALNHHVYAVLDKENRPLLKLLGVRSKLIQDKYYLDLKDLFRLVDADHARFHGEDGGRKICHVLEAGKAYLVGDTLFNYYSEWSSDVRRITAGDDIGNELLSLLETKRSRMIAALRERIIAISKLDILAGDFHHCPVVGLELYNLFTGLFNQIDDDFDECSGVTTERIDRILPIALELDVDLFIEAIETKTGARLREHQNPVFQSTFLHGYIMRGKQ
jgi:hypothetical protein